MVLSWLTVFASLAQQRLLGPVMEKDISYILELFIVGCFVSDILLDAYCIDIDRMQFPPCGCQHSR